jgi:signal peptidase II
MNAELFRVRRALAITASLIYLADYVSKSLAIHFLTGRTDGGVQIIGNFLRLELRYNSGAAFSFATSKTLLLTSLAMAASIAIVIAGRRLRSTPWAIALGLALGGIVGNLSDRIFREPQIFQGSVVDWIKLTHWPTFNIADSSIVIAAIVVTLLSYRGIHPFGPKTNGDIKDA